MKFYSLKSTMQKHKKYRFLLVFIVIICFVLAVSPFGVVSASTNDDDDILSASVSDIVDALDLSELQDILDGLESKEIFGNDISATVNDILSGKYFTNYSSVFGGIVSLLFANLKSMLPIIFCIIAIGVLSSLLSSFRSDSSETSDMVYFVCYALIVMLILISFKDILSSVSKVIKGISSLMQIVFPILISLLVSIGSLSSISIYNPLVAVLTTIVDIIFDKFLYPIFILIFLLTVLGNLTSSVKLDKLTTFFSSAFKWTTGIVFTLFTGFLSLQGISAGKFDSISIKATKFAVKSYIPLIGSYVADGMDYIVLGSVLVKNTIGLVAIMLLFVMILSPIIYVVCYKLLLELTAGVLETSGSNKMSSFISSVSKCLMLPIVIVVGVAFMFVITIALIMCTANIF